MNSMSAVQLAAMAWLHAAQ